MEEAGRSVQSCLPGDAGATRARSWPGFAVMTARLPGGALDVDGLTAHTLAVNIGRPFRLEGRVAGRTSESHMRAGFMKLIEAGPRSRWRWDAAEPIDMLHVSIDDASLGAYAGELEFPRRPEIITRIAFADGALSAVAAGLATELERPATGSLVADALRIELILHLLAGHSSVAGRELVAAPRKRLGRRSLQLLDEYIEAHLGADIAMSDLAALCGMSRFHLARLFRATVGTSPHRYVIDRRVARARELLRHGDLSLRDVAAATGFADQSHLTREMKRRYGVTPGALRAS